MIKVYDVTPMAKPRMTQSDKWKKRPVVQKYWAYKAELKLLNAELPLSGAHVIFVLPMAKSWSKKMKTEMDGKPHQQKPDWDNLAKGLMDAIYDDDSLNWNQETTKVWGKSGAIIIEHRDSPIVDIEKMLKRINKAKELQNAEV